MAKIVRFMNNIRMRNKFFLCFAVILLIPIGISVYFSISMRASAKQTTTNDAIAAVDRVAARTEQLLTNTVYYASGFVYNTSLANIINARYDSAYGMVLGMWASTAMINTAYIYERDVSELHIYVNNPVLSTGYIRPTPADIAGADWYIRAYQEKRPPFWRYIPGVNFNGEGSSLTYISPVYGGSGNVYGVLTMHIRQNALNAIFEQEDGMILLIAPDGTVIASKDPSQIGRNAADFGLAQGSREVENIRYQNVPTTVINESLTVKQTEGTFHIVSLVPDKDIFKLISQITDYMILILSIGIVLSLLIALLISRLLTSRLARVSADIHRAAAGDLDFNPTVDGSDEIGSLSGDLTTMLESVRQLIGELNQMHAQSRQLEAEQHKMQMRVLSSQLNPHFLFNALESIRMRAVVQEENEIASAIQMISGLLRKSLYMGDSPIPLSEELEFAENYLKIQQLRFGSKCQYKITILTDISRQNVLPFLLQPIVENAVQHGIEETEKDGRFVSIVVMREGANLMLRVIDNGAGMSAEVLSHVLAGLDDTDNPPKEHIGIANVNQRVKLNYGGDYGVRISSRMNAGTGITIILPYTTEENNDV